MACDQCRYSPEAKEFIEQQTTANALEMAHEELELKEEGRRLEKLKEMADYYKNKAAVAKMNLEEKKRVVDS